MFLLVPVAWALAFTAAASRTRTTREAAILALTGVSVVMLALTEALSALRALSTPWLPLAWALLVLLLAIVARRAIASGWRRLGEALREHRHGGSVAVIVMIVVFALGTFLSAILYPTTNFDSLTYHMPRVVMWFQNHSVAHFSSADGRLVFSSPLVEYWVLQLKILSAGSDRLANLVQWVSYVFTIVTASLVARRLGAGRRGQQLAALVAAVTPMAVLQASTTQNDLTCALWSLAAAYWIVDYAAANAGARFGWWRVGALGGALALAYQAKPPAYLFTAAFLVWVAIAVLRREGWKRCVVLAGSVGLLVVALNAGWYARNAADLGGDVLGLSAPGNTHILIQDRDPGDIVSNALKNSSMLLGTPSGRVNGALASAVRRVIGAYGGTVENAANKESADQPYEIDGHVVSHDVGPSPMIALLVLLAAVLLLTARSPERRVARWYLLAAAASFFAVTGLIKWNHFVNRVTLGALLLLVPLVGVAAKDALRRFARPGRAAVAALLVLATLWGAAPLLFNTTNRLLPPSALPVQVGNRDVGWWNTPYDQLRFRVLVGPLEDPMRSIAEVAEREDMRVLAIDQFPGNAPLYPLMTLLQDRRFEYVDHLEFKARRESHVAPDGVLVVRMADELTPVAPGPSARGRIVYGPVTSMGLVLTLYDPR